MVRESLSYCGLQCLTCPIYLATRVENEAERRQMRTKIAAQCRELYGVRFEVEDITDCDGCQAGGRLFQGCATCPVRSCAEKKRVETCAECAEYPCTDLQAFLAKEPDAKQRLEQIRASRFQRG